MKGKNEYQYQVALSFAGEERKYVEAVATILKNNKITVFYDEFEEDTLWGKNLYEYLNDIYSKKAKYTVMFISENYARKLWTNHERTSMQSRAFKESEEYILPVRFDDTEIIGLNETIGYLDLRNIKPEDLATKIIDKTRGGNSKNTIFEYIDTHSNVGSQDEWSLNILMEFIPFTKLLGYVNSLPTSINLEFLGIDDTLNNFKLDFPHCYPFDNEELNNVFVNFLQSYIDLTYMINGFYKDKPVYGQVPDGYIERGIHVIFFNKNSFTFNEKNELITNIEERKLEFIDSYNSLILFIRKKYKNVKLDSYKYSILSTI